MLFIISQKALLTGNWGFCQLQPEDRGEHVNVGGERPDSPEPMGPLFPQKVIESALCDPAQVEQDGQ